MSDTHDMSCTVSSPWELTFTIAVEKEPETKVREVIECVKTTEYDLFCDEVKLACQEIDSIIANTT